MLTSRAWPLAGAGALLGFFVLAAMVTVGGGHDALDSAVTQAVIGVRTPTLTAAAQIATFIGSATFLLPLTLLLLGALAWRHRHWLPVLVMAAGSWIGVSGVAVVKTMVGRARPPAVDELGVAVSDASLPSGHTTAATIVYLLGAVLLCLGARAAVRRTALLLAGTVAVLVGASRVYLGYHWLSDVVAGWLLGFAVVAAGAYVVARWMNARTAPPFATALSAYPARSREPV